MSLITSLLSKVSSLSSGGVPWFTIGSISVLAGALMFFIHTVKVNGEYEAQIKAYQASIQQSQLQIQRMKEDNEKSLQILAMEKQNEIDTIKASSAQEKVIATQPTESVHSPAITSTLNFLRSRRSTAR